MQEPSRRGKRKLRSQGNLLIQWDLRTQSWTWDFGEKSGILEVCSAPVESGLCKVRNEKRRMNSSSGRSNASIPESLWIFHPWKCPRLGIGAAWHGGKLWVHSGWNERILNPSQPKPIHDSWFLLTSQKSPRNEDQREEFHSQDFLGPPASQKMEDTSEGQDKNLITQWDEQWGADFKHWAFKNNKKKTTLEKRQWIILGAQPGGVFSIPLF